MTTMTEFLLARIAEDEAAARAATSDSGLIEASKRADVAARGRAADAAHIARHDPARVLAECEAKRRIVAWDAEQYVGYGILELLALPYADHPDFDEAWRP